jgi:PhoPQ-activated pathogenicity-related protein
MNHKTIHFFIISYVLLFDAIVFATALDDYVAAPDTTFAWSQYGSYFDDSSPLSGGTDTRAYVLTLTSQTWRNTSEVNPTVWTHWVTVIIPRNDWLWGATKNTALLLINGGTVGESAPRINPVYNDYTAYRQLAFATRSVIVELRCVPNQPLYFTDEYSGRVEDEIIAYSWDKFLSGGDSYWPAQLPMVKSVVRCMDAVQQLRPAISHFVLTGGSKRGWTAWLTAAVDSRVSAIAPIVSDLLNMKRSFAHHWSAYGFWAEALSPYEKSNIFDWFENPRTNDLLSIVDPFEYRDRLTLPKLIVTAAGDDFFVHDSIQFYIDSLSGETYVRTLPNTNHYLEGAMKRSYPIWCRITMRFFEALRAHSSVGPVKTTAVLSYTLQRHPNRSCFGRPTIRTAGTFDR